MLTDRELAALPENCPEDWDNLSAQEKETVTAWIRDYLTPSRSGERHSSYGLKHIMDSDTGLYVTNGQMKGGMAACGYPAQEPDVLNWVYRVKVRKGARG